MCVVDARRIDALIDRLKVEYPKQAGRSFTIYLTQPQDGAAVLIPSRSMTPETLALQA